MTITLRLKIIAEHEVLPDFLVSETQWRIQEVTAPSQEMGRYVILVKLQPVVFANMD